MQNIVIISASIRDGRKSHHVARYFQNLIKDRHWADVTLIDLKESNFPLFDERLNRMNDPEQRLVDFSETIRRAGGILIVTPEYNGGYPAALKNAIDLLHEEWQMKPIAIASVSSGDFGASQVLTSLSFSLWKIGALLVPALFQVPRINSSFNNDEPSDKEKTDQRAEKFIGKLLWLMDAVRLKAEHNNADRAD